MGLLEKFQDIIENYPQDVEILKALVVEDDPLKIVIEGNSKRIVPSALIQVPKHLTDYVVEASVVIGSESSEASLQVKNSLKKGEYVYCLSFSRGNMYLILDKVG